MRKNDRQLGTPSLEYTDTKANIEALTGIAEGAVAYASDTDELGTYDGSVWTWGSGGGMGDVVGPASAVDSNFAAFNTTTGKLIKDSGVLTSDVSSAVSASHTRSHAITGTSDHTSSATPGQILKADASGLPIDATNTDAAVSAAVTASHAAVTLDANADTLLSLSTQALGLDTQTANTVFAGATSGGAAVPAFRALVAADIPALGYEPADATIVKTGNASWIDLTDGGATTLHSHAGGASDVLQAKSLISLGF